ncbi:hypothetical protein [Paracoccus sp. 08]|uniref:hypothetical protein n=1 Tax=Paracoccus sp. 08 TaxID=2606624 RepID=UPI0020943FA5|nr:hypothetical protein [Paracoccus sp. 08]MCO6363874.1 hypothetical protein [Paracoccus sp. 08]
MNTTRFEVRLSQSESKNVMADMRRRGAASRADYLRDCLLGGRAGRADRLTEELGQLGLVLNAIVHAVPTGEDAVDGDLGRLVSDGSALMRRIVRDLNRRGWE